jgi:hypothetical protein
LKAAYEEANATLEGKKAALIRHSLRGSRPTDCPPDHVPEGEGNFAGSGSDGDGPVAPPVVVESDPVAPSLPHVSTGIEGDKNIFINNTGQLVRLDINGRLFLSAVMDSASCLLLALRDGIVKCGISSAVNNSCISLLVSNMKPRRSLSLPCPLVRLLVTRGGRKFLRS